MRALSHLQGRRVVVLPDLFVDVSVAMGNWREAAAGMDAIAQRGGGNLPVAGIHIGVGGNAANMAIALAGMDIPTHLIAEADDTGRRLIEERARGMPLSLERVRSGAAAATVALESDDANVMLSDAGPVASFGPDALHAADDALLAQADAVAVLNWAQNRRGTDLLRSVARRRPNGGLLYLDTGDPRHCMQRIPELLATAQEVGVDAWGMNENEARAFGGHDDPVEAARHVAETTGVRVDLHTRSMAASIHDDVVTTVPADDAPAVRLTGAGDHWNAGNLAGYLLHLPAKERLAMAHQAATRHVAVPAT